MAVFKAGQRVKIVRCCAEQDRPRPDQIADMKGCTEGVLMRRMDRPSPEDIFGQIFGDIFGVRGDWLMRLDNGVEGAVFEYMIEPIQPERNQVVAWSEVPGGHPEHREVIA